MPSGDPVSPDLATPPLPSVLEWARLGMTVGRELPGGHQSRVFAADHRGESVVIKLVDRHAAATAFHRRLDTVAIVAERTDDVVGPIAVKGQLVTEMGPWLTVVFPYIDGSAPDTGVEADVRSMAATLADLHRTLDTIEPTDLPVVPGLASASPLGPASSFGPMQLLHGDYSGANIRVTALGHRVFDFDDCGYGPIEFEVGNTLYMELFGAPLQADLARYERFRTQLVDAYRSVSGRAVPDSVVDEAIDIRVATLAQWIASPQTAPIGIRFATPEWRAVLASFVRDHGSRRRAGDETGGTR